MVAKITIPKSIEAALNYNEKKVQKGLAQCIYAGNYLKDAEKLNFYQKLSGFNINNRLNKMAITKTLHVSLNFDPSEKHTDDKLVEIASTYMNKIGFGDQPFLVYKHQDAGHPHIHVVSTTIRNDGSRINTHNIGRNQSETARKEIEALFSLVKAERKRLSPQPGIQPLSPDKAVYGLSETKTGITKVVAAVFYQYKFASLAEYNAALRQFNVVADRGKEESRIFQNGGLVYRILDADGNKVGVPIKASSIAGKPILKNVEKKFALNAAAKEMLGNRIKTAIDDCLAEVPGSMKDLAGALQEKQIYVALRKNPQGRIYGITFVDNQQKVVFNGSDLGKGYSVAALQSRLSKIGGNQPAQNAHEKSKPPIIASTVSRPSKIIEKELPGLGKKESLLDVLLSTKEEHTNIPSGLIKKKRKKKRRNHDF